MAVVIPPKDTPFVDLKTGQITKPWYQYLHEGNLVFNDTTTFGQQIQALTADATPDRLADYVGSSADTKILLKILNPWTTVIKTANETLTTDTNYQDDNALTFSVAASTKYSFRGVIHYDTPAAADFKSQFTGPASPTLVRIFYQWGMDTSANIQLISDVFSDSIPWTDTTGTEGGISFYGIVQNGTNAGTVTLQWAQNAASGTTTVYGGSWLEWMTVV